MVTTLLKLDLKMFLLEMEIYRLLNYKRLFETVKNFRNAHEIPRKFLKILRLPIVSFRVFSIFENQYFCYSHHLSCEKIPKTKLFLSALSP